MKRSPRKTAPLSPLLKALLIAGCALIALVVLIEWVAAPLVLKSLNKSLNKNPEYQNQVGGLDINPLSGGYTLKDFQIRRVWGDTFLPVFTAKSIDVSLHWTSLFQGKTVGEISMREPSLYFVKPFLKPKKHPKPLAATLRRFYPFPINGLKVRDGAIHYQDLDTRENNGVSVDLYFDEVNGNARGLAALDSSVSANSADSADRRATVWITARAMGRTPAKVEMAMIPGAPYPDLELSASLGDLPLTSLNKLFRAYADLDVEAGTIGFTTNIEARGGKFKGVLHPHLNNLRILDERKDKGLVKKAWEAIADAAGKLLEKESKVVAGGERPLSGSFTRTGQDEWKALGSLIIGAFVHSMDPRLGKFIPPQEGIRWDVIETSR